MFMYNQQSESLTFQQFWILILKTTKNKVKNAKNIKIPPKSSKNQIKLMQIFPDFSEYVKIKKMKNWSIRWNFGFWGAESFFLRFSDHKIQIGEELIFFHPITKEKLNSDYKIWIAQGHFRKILQGVLVRVRVGKVIGSVCYKVDL